MDAAVWYSSLLVRQALADDGGVYLDHLLTNSNIPAWRTGGVLLPGGGPAGDRLRPLSASGEHPRLRGVFPAI